MSYCDLGALWQLLEELADNGFPLVTEPNALNSLIAPPSMGRRVLEFVTGTSRVSDTIGTAAMSVIPWRKSVRAPPPDRRMLGLPQQHNTHNTGISCCLPPQSW